MILDNFGILNLGIMERKSLFGFRIQPCLVRAYGFNTTVMKCADACVSGVG